LASRHGNTIRSFVWAWSRKRQLCCLESQERENVCIVLRRSHYSYLGSAIPPIAGRCCRYCCGLQHGCPQTYDNNLHVEGKGTTAHVWRRPGNKHAFSTTLRERTGCGAICHTAMVCNHIFRLSHLLALQPPSFPLGICNSCSHRCSLTLPIFSHLLRFMYKLPSMTIA
jgi:hypothetical protein